MHHLYDSVVFLTPVTSTGIGNMAATADRINEIQRERSPLAYPLDARRDLRIDFLRGMVMFLLIIVHIEIVSIYNLLVWERIGVVSGGEGFVILSGIVIGMVYGPRFMNGNSEPGSDALVRRSLQLYRINIAMILFTALLMAIPFINADAISTFTNRGTGEVFQLFPSLSAPLKEWVGRVVLLRSGPHQFQIMGLYVFLLLISPIALQCMAKGWTPLVLTIAWVIYVYQWVDPRYITGAQFEYGFPLLTWQLTYLHGVAIGVHRAQIAELLADSRVRRTLLIVCGVLFIAFAFFTQNNPNPRLPDWTRISVIPPDTFNHYYSLYFKKNTLGLLRILNYTVVLILAYYVLSRFWGVFNRFFGWYFVPLGQASLYAFILHVPYVMLIDLIPAFNQGSWIMNTIAHTIVLSSIWLMVKAKFLFRWIPR